MAKLPLAHPLRKSKIALAKKKLERTVAQPPFTRNAVTATGAAGFPAAKNRSGLVGGERKSRAVTGAGKKTGREQSTPVEKSTFRWYIISCCQQSR